MLEAVAEGVVTAKAHAQRCGLGLLPIGINSTVLFGPAEPFLSDLVAVGGRAMCDALDYVGLDIFPDVFRPVPADRLATITTALLGEHREHRLRPAGLGDVPLRITEHGWPTGPDRSPARQAEVLTTVVGVLVDNAAALNLEGYSHFSLRDADTARSGLFHRFGLMTDDYQPKPAFGVYRDLISRHAG